MSGGKYAIDVEAYERLMLHAQRYPTQQVCGVLLGRTDTGPAAGVELLEAVPLLHGHVLAPLLDAALLQLEVYCARRALSVLASYHAHEQLDDAKPHGVALRIADAVVARSPNACLLYIDCQKPAAQLRIQVYEGDGASSQQQQQPARTWRPSEHPLRLLKGVTAEEAQRRLAGALQERKQWAVVDFQEQLDSNADAAEWLPSLSS
eukprot:TRINITY_DN255_c0_g1_i3.p2 TRINITY_DN255_c0_g1~~TRINITY_DN255_c0_g1_i3.p2  ORF type:complete len:206 (-),score=84.82 TRINITY_DN255_c0_g1_i3:357-974(-)